jgi:hypothetical protein
MWNDPAKQEKLAKVFGDSMAGLGDAGAGNRGLEGHVPTEEDDDDEQEGGAGARVAGGLLRSPGRFLVANVGVSKTLKCIRGFSCDCRRR